jgi:hypothetical protein
LSESPDSLQPWKQYEIAVALFIRALDPEATVTHDAKTPDGDTGSPRQRDIWIEGRLCKLFPIRVLVSCKRYGRVLNELDLDHFIGELATSRANKGVIYSFEGFNELAIEKAKAHSIECLKLYENQPPDIPEILAIPHSYCCYPRLQLSLVWIKDAEHRLRTWNDFFNRPSGSSDPDLPVIDFIYSILSQNQQKVVDQLPGSGLPLDWLFECTFIDPEYEELQLRLRIAQTWDFYEAKLDAYIINGSYSFTEKQFFGKIMSPAIDTWSAAPGAGWSKCPSRPSVHGGHIAFAFMFGDIRKAIRERTGPKEIAHE